MQIYSKTCVKWPHLKRPKFGFQDQLSLNAGRKHYRMLQVERNILQYFRLSLSYQLLLRSLFCLFSSGRFTQVLLYMYDYDSGLKQNVKCHCFYSRTQKINVK